MTETATIAQNPYSELTLDELVARMEEPYHGYANIKAYLHWEENQLVLYGLHQVHPQADVQQWTDNALSWLSNMVLTLEKLTQKLSLTQRDVASIKQAGGNLNQLTKAIDTGIKNYAIARAAEQALHPTATLFVDANAPEREEKLKFYKSNHEDLKLFFSALSSKLAEQEQFRRV